MFNPAKGAKTIKEDFIDYITTTLHFNDEGDGLSSLYEKFINKLAAKARILDSIAINNYSSRF